MTQRKSTDNMSRKELNHQNKNQVLDGNFKQLDELIQLNTKIRLEKDFYLDSDEKTTYLNGIKINKNIIIEGDNHIIDARGKSRIFNIDCEKIILKNIIFKNGYNIDDGGAINHKNGTLDIFNCTFINNSSDKQGGVLSSSNSKLVIINTKFFNNQAYDIGCINFSTIRGFIELNNCEFKNNSAKNNTSVIRNTEKSTLNIKNTIFDSNHANNAGTILNWGKCVISNSTFKGNSVDNDAGAIDNRQRSRLKITNSKFLNNSANGDGGAILNYSRLTLEKVLFFKNFSSNQAGAISNQKEGFINITDSEFENNISDMTSGSILNWGKIQMESVNFRNNASKEFGGAILNQESSFLLIKKSKLINNEVEYAGGAILNKSRMILKDILIKNNKSKFGGAINCSKKSTTVIERCDFISNTSDNGGCIFNNSADTKVIECNFSKNFTENIIYNSKSMSCYSNDFYNNKIKNIILNDENGILNILLGSFSDNELENVIIYNKGNHCNITQTVFENNPSKSKYCNIINETYMIINDLKLMSNEKTVLNNGILDVKKISEDILISNIHNMNEMNDFSKKSNNPYDFSYLNDKIHNNKSSKLELSEDVKIELYELDYFEGGIEITTDNLIIDGKNHAIDGREKSRIFIINAKNVTLENLIFKNGFYRTYMDKQYNGGGAIHILENASLILKNSIFLDNSSNSNAGAILNEGCVNSYNTKFINNTSNSYGGAIHNKKNLNIYGNEFKDNSARIAGAIYNQGQLNIEINNILENNNSDFNEEIYNAGSISIDYDSNSIYNTSKINEKSQTSIPFTSLENAMKDSDEIKLTNDIVFDYTKDKLLKYIITIENNLIIDGNGFSIEFDPTKEELYFIDGNKSSALFKINDEINVVLKNIIFKNCYTNNRSIIENNGNLTIENCRFINNQITQNNNLIKNTGYLKINNTYFSNNISNKQSLINNSLKLEITDSKFINNNSNAIGTCLTNSKDTLIKNSVFKSNTTSNNGGTIFNRTSANLKIINNNFEHNFAKIDAGAIYNYGNISIHDSNFTKNESEDEGGVINSRTSGKIRIFNTKFFENKSHSSGGVIYNYGDIEIKDSKFRKNASKYRASVIEHEKALDNRNSNVLKISNSEFINNTQKEIFTFHDNNLHLKDCTFN